MPFWKSDGPSQKVERAKRTNARAARLRNAKETLRTQGKGCRVPLCGCKRFRLRLEAGHKKHQGMGGNPAEDRNDTRNMVLVCAERHQDNPISLHKGTLKWEPFYDNLGADGPIRWFVDLDTFLYLTHQVAQRPTRPNWYEVASEKAPYDHDTFSPQQRAILKQLALMEL